jgi:DNA modification methylase
LRDSDRRTQLRPRARMRCNPTSIDRGAHVTLSTSNQASTTVDPAAILRDLQQLTYEETARKHSVSRGTVYAIAVKAGARKHEQRILQKNADRKTMQREFLQSVINATQTSDALDFLAGLPTGSISLHLSSPPYNIGKSYGGGHGDGTAFHYYLGYLLQVCSELVRTLADGGTLMLQVGATHGPDGRLYPIDSMLHEHLRCMGLTFQSRIVWIIPHGLTPKRRLAERYETCLVFSKGEQRTFNATPAREPQKQPGKRAFKGPRKGELSGHAYGAHPTNVWRISNAGNNRGRVDWHPAQMPLEFARRGILLYTAPGDLVADVFCGSGTTLIAAKQTGRAFTGADLCYESHRRERLAQVRPDLVTLLPGVTDESLAVWEAEATPVYVPATMPCPAQAPLFAAA